MGIKNASDCNNCGSPLIEGDNAYCDTCYSNIQDDRRELNRIIYDLRREIGALEKEALK